MVLQKTSQLLCHRKVVLQVKFDPHFVSTGAGGVKTIVPQEPDQWPNGFFDTFVPVSHTTTPSEEGPNSTSNPKREEKSSLRLDRPDSPL
jgi:hypothetical protein